MRIKLLVAACVAAAVLSLAGCGSHSGDRPAQFVGTWNVSHLASTWVFNFNADGSFHGDDVRYGERLDGQWYVKDGAMHWVYNESNTPLSSMTAPDLTYKMKIVDNDNFETWDAKGNQSIFKRAPSK